jgi:hypothetical protein
VNRRFYFMVAAVTSLKLFSSTLYTEQPAIEGKTIRIVWN